MRFEEEKERRLIAEEYAHSNNCSIVSDELLKEIKPLEKEWLTNLSGPKYYALIKGHELLERKGDWVVPTYWCLDTTNRNMFISDRITVRDKFLIEASKSEWNKLGINDSNADFIKVEVAE